MTFDPAAFESQAREGRTATADILPFFGIGGPAHLTLRSVPAALDIATLDRALAVRRKVFAGDAAAFTAEDVKFLGLAETYAGFSNVVKGSVRNDDGRRDPASAACWSAFAAWRDSLHGVEVGQSPTFADDPAYLGYLDRPVRWPVAVVDGRLSITVIDPDEFRAKHLRFLEEAPPMDKLSIPFDDGTLRQMFDAIEWPTKGKLLRRLWPVDQMISYGDIENFQREEVEHFLAVMDMPAVQRGFMPFMDNDMIHSWRATRAWLEWKRDHLK